MEFTSVLGAGVLGGLIILGAVTGQLPAFFLNAHGLVIVLGGSFGALIFGTPIRELRLALQAAGRAWRTQRLEERDAIEASVTLAESFRRKGAAAWREADARVLEGLLARAAEVAVIHNEPKIVEDILIAEANADYDRETESANVFRTLGILAPMFGLLGTLIGIVSVLREISNPESVGKAMAVALTTAFYGISLANMVCVPIAGLIRLKSMRKLRARSLICEGVVSALRTEAPASIRSRLEARL